MLIEGYQQQEDKLDGMGEAVTTKTLTTNTANVETTARVKGTVQIDGQLKVGGIATVFGEKSDVVLNGTKQTALTVTFDIATLPVVATITFVSAECAYSSKFLFDGTSVVTPLYSESTLGTPVMITAASDGATATFKHTHASVPGGTTTGTLFYEVSGEEVSLVQ